jgi:hypothetical protein
MRQIPADVYGSAQACSPTGGRSRRTVVYDFWPGPWFEVFERRYPSAPGYALDVEALHPRRYERFDVTISMDHEASLRFMLTERAEADPDWLRQQLAALGPEFVFHSYLAEIVPS